MACKKRWEMLLHLNNQSPFLSLIRRIQMFPQVQVQFEGQFPADFSIKFPGWGCFDRKTIEENKGKLLMLDIDKGFHCSRRCRNCFRQSPGFRHSDLKEMDEYTLYSAICEAVGLGLREVKILGAGEPFEDTRFLRFLRYLSGLSITTSVFTKGQVIASDELARRYNEAEGITTGRALAEELYRLNVSLIVGFNAIEAEAQDAFTCVSGHTLLRNRAIELLAEVGFNKTNPTRLALGCSPTTHENIHEAPAVYRWARERNISTVICPTMTSAYDERWREIVPTADDQVDAYTEIYRFNLERGIQTLEELKQDNISAYAGVNPCNQIGCGLYITLDGVVHGCPGDDYTIHGDVKKQEITEIWENSPNRRKYAGIYNVHCPAKTGKSITPRIFSEVVARLEKG